MTKKLVWILVVIIVIVAIIIGVNSSKETGGKVIKIGSIAARTGVGVGIGEEEYKGAQLAVEEINANGGIRGRELMLISEDVSVDKLKNAGAVANKLINVDKVVAIVGPQWDEPALAMLPIIENAKVPTIGPDVTDTVETPGLGDYLFSTWYDNRVGIEVLLKHAQDNDLRNIAVVRPVDAGFWKFASDEFVRRASEFGINIVDDIDLGNPLLTDFRTHLAKIKQKNPQAVFTVTADPMQCPFFKQMKELGLHIPVLATESSGNNASLESCAGDMSNLYFSTPLLNHDGYKNFENSFVNKYGKKPLFPTAVTAYDAVMVLADALEKTDGMGGESLQKALSATQDYAGASLPFITFKSNGFVETPKDVFKMMNVKDGKFVEVN